MITVWYKGKPVTKVSPLYTAHDVAEELYGKYGDVDVWRDVDGWSVDRVSTMPVKGLRRNDPISVR